MPRGGASRVAHDDAIFPGLEQRSVVLYRCVLGYSAEDQILYANDGCNSCTHRLAGDLKALNKAERDAFAALNKIRLELVEKISQLAR